MVGWKVAGRLSNDELFVFLNLEFCNCWGG